MNGKYLLLVLLLLLSFTQLVALPKTANNLAEEYSKHITTIDTKKLSIMLSKNPNIKIIDVRSVAEVLDQGGFIQANKRFRIHRNNLETAIGDAVNENEIFVVYSTNTNTSLFATKQLHDMGYKKALHYKDGFSGWREAGNEVGSLDKYRKSMLYSEIQEISKGVYTSIGVTAPYRYESTAHNNNLGFVVGEKSVLVWNAGSSFLLAQSLHQEIKKITKLPVKYVLLENSQGHALLGTSYWQEQGAIVVAQENVKDEYNIKGKQIFNRMENVLKDKFVGTKLSMPDKFFKDKMVFDLGGRSVEALYFGYAHEHSDISIWLPKEKIVFAGDIAFNNRLLPIFKITQTLKWLEAWEKFASLKPKIVVPGHGDTTDLKTVEKYTKGYLIYMRKKIEELIDDDGGLKDAYLVDQSPYEHLDTFKELSVLNAATLFEQMEFE